MLNHVGTQKLETERLILRRYKMADADDMFNNWATDPEVSRFWQWEPHESINVTNAVLSDWIEEYKKTDYYLWVIVLKEISQAIGYIYLADIDNNNNSMSIHFALSKRHWNQGIMTEACNRVLEFSFHVLKAERVHTNHHIDNPASGRVQQKSGMKYIKTAYKHVPEYEQISGDYCFYEITSKEWKNQNVIGY